MDTRPEGKRPVERLRFSGRDNVRMDLKVVSEFRHWIHLAQDRNQL
jgi:hypothetical protein